MKFCAEVDLEVIRIVKHIKETASFFKLRDAHSPDRGSTEVPLVYTFLVIRENMPNRYCLLLNFIIDRQVRRLIDFGWL